MTIRKNLMTFVSAGLMLAALTACEKKIDPATGKGPAEMAGQKIDQAAEKANHDMNKAAEEAKAKMNQATADASQSINNATVKVGEKVEQAGEKIQAAGNK